MRAIIFSVLMASSVAASASAQSTAFTYQGRLKNGAQLASGPHDFRFALFNAASGGAQVGTTQCSDNIAVSDGVFTATIDFGRQFATPEPRYLQIEVRADTGLPCSNLSGLVTLGPRQPINPAPAASHANSAFSLDAPDGSPANAVFVDNDGRVGLGTASPAGRLDIQGSNSSNILFGRRTGGGLAHNLYIDSAGNGSMQLLDSTGSPRVEFANGLTYFNYGNVGIGTATPAAKLQVVGDVKLGSSGQLSAMGGVVSLRVIAGAINWDGTTQNGNGFSSQRLATGLYRVTFDAPFTGRPIVTATTSAGCVCSLDPLTYALIQDSTLGIEPGYVDVRVVKRQDGEVEDRRFYFTAIGPR